MVVVRARLSKQHDNAPNFATVLSLKIASSLHASELSSAFATFSDDVQVSEVLGGSDISISITLRPLMST